MRFLRNLVILIFLLAAGFVGGAFLLPQNVVVERQITIEVPPGDVFPLVNSLQSGAEWSPWLERDPNVQITYEGPEAGVGAVMSWTSEEPTVGNGRQEVVESVENERVATALDFGDMGTAEAWFDLVEEGDGTQVTWGLNADMGSNPVGRWMGLMMDRWVGADYEQGLANLKALAEAG